MGRPETAPPRMDAAAPAAESRHARKGCVPAQYRIQQNGGSPYDAKVIRPNPETAGSRAHAMKWPQSTR